MLDKCLLLPINGQASMYSLDPNQIIIWQPLAIGGDKLLLSPHGSNLDKWRMAPGIYRTTLA